MDKDKLHYAALIATARLELDHAHRAALAVEAGDLRRGLQLALNALDEAAGAEREADAEPAAEKVAAVRTVVAQALADLGAGALSEVGNLIEAARKTLNHAG